MAMMTLSEVSNPKRNTTSPYNACKHAFAQCNGSGYVSLSAPREF